MATRLITVHGTFAPQAPWSRPDSPFCRVMEKRLGPLTVSAVDWSGRNTFDARQEGATALLQELASEDDKDDDVVVVAHSHGGSVVHYAYARDAPAFDRVKAVVCMSTPYIGAAVRPGFETLFNAGLAALATLLFQAVFWLAIAAVHHFWRGISESSIAVAGLGFAAAALAFFIARRAYRARDKFFRGIGGAVAAGQGWDTTQIGVPGLTVVRSTGDEVAFFLSTLQFFCTLTGVALGFFAMWADRFSSAVRQWLKRPVPCAALVSLAVLMLLCSAFPALLGVVFGFSTRQSLGNLWMWNPSYMSFFQSPVLDFSARATFQLGIFAVALFDVSAVLFLLIALTIWVLSVGTLRWLGAWNIRAALAMQFAVEPAPEGRHLFINAGWERRAKELARRGFTLQHSESYMSEAAVTAIGDVLAERLGRAS